MDFSIVELAVGAVATIITVAGGFLARYLNNQAQLLKDQDSTFIRGQLQQAALEVAAAIAERSYPRIAQMVESGEIKNAEEAKGALYELGGIAREELRAAYPDLVDRTGPSAIDLAIRSAADAVSPFPGKDTAKELLSGGAKLLLERGVHLINDRG